MDQYEKDIELKKIALDRDKLANDTARLQLEQDKSNFERRFWHRNFGTMTTFSVAFLGLVLSGGQVWTAHIQKNRDQIQKNFELDLSRSQKQEDRVEAEMHDLRDFLLKEDARIFSPDEKTRENVKQLMLYSFSSKVVEPVIKNLSAFAPVSQKDTWKQAAAQLDVRVKGDALVYVQYQDKSDEGLADGVIAALKIAGYRAPGKQLVTQQTKGDVRYFHRDESDQATSIAALVSQNLRSQGRDQTLIPLFVGQSFPNVAPGTFEVWIPKSN